MRILVTGGAGFLGSTVVDALLARHHEVIALDDLSTGSASNLPPGVPLLRADISDRRAVEEACGALTFDAVVHAAAKTKVVESIANPDLYERVIVGGTANVLALATAVGARRFVNISTGGAMYGETPSCADESAPIRPLSPYGTCKAEAEAIVARATGLSVVTLRFANIYGPRQRGDLEGGVVAIFARSWREGGRLIVFGDGEAERDYVYVADCAEAIYATLQSDSGGLYNIGTGVATSVNQLIASMTLLLGHPPAIERAPARAGELQRSCLDPSRAGQDGLWYPRTQLLDGLRSTVNAFRL